VTEKQSVVSLIQHT